MRYLALQLVLIITTSGMAFFQTKPYPKPQTASAEEKVAPDFTLEDHDGKQFRLSEQRGHWVLLYFYRGYW